MLCIGTGFAFATPQSKIVSDPWPNGKVKTRTDLLYKQSGSSELKFECFGDEAHDRFQNLGDEDWDHCGDETKETRDQHVFFGNFKMCLYDVDSADPQCKVFFLTLFLLLMLLLVVGFDRQTVPGARAFR